MIDKVLIAGAGQVGSEIGFQCAVHGLNVVMFDVAQSSLDQSRTSHAEYSAMFKSKGLLRNGDDTGKVLSRILTRVILPRLAPMSILSASP